MKFSEYRSKSKELFKVKRSNSLTNGILSGVLIIAILSLDFVYSSAYLFTVPFFILPIFFAFIMNNIGLNDGRDYATGNIFVLFRLYFSRNFAYTFKAWKCLFKALLFGAVMNIVISLTCTNLIAEKIPEYVSFMQEVQNLYTSGDFSYTTLATLVQENSYAINSYALMFEMPVFLLQVILFIVFIAQESLELVFKTRTLPLPERLVSRIKRTTIIKRRNEWLKAFFGLNWPIIVLLLAGMVTGAAVSLQFVSEANVVQTISIMSGLLFLTPFLPKFFINIQVIGEAMFPTFEEEGTKFLNNIFGAMGQNINGNSINHDFTKKNDESVDDDKKSDDND